MVKHTSMTVRKRLKDVLDRYFAVSTDIQSPNPNPSNADTKIIIGTIIITQVLPKSSEPEMKNLYVRK